MDRYLDWTYDKEAYGTLPDVVKNLHDHDQKHIIIVVSGHQKYMIIVVIGHQRYMIIVVSGHQKYMIIVVSGHAHVTS